MKEFIHVLIAAILTVGCMMPIVVTDPAFAQAVPPSQTLKGQLLTIKGEVYVLRDATGRFVRVRVDKNTKRERPLVPGEKIEAQMSPDGRALSIKPTN